MTAVNISGTFKRDSRPFNGLEAIADQLLDHELADERYVVVAVVRPHASKWSAEDGIETPTVRFDQIEVLGEDAAKQARVFLDDVYRERTKGTRQPDLFDQQPEGDGPVSERQPDEWLDGKVEG
jgi:hypothetical protein